jgi:CheY-like chemotaxis protein
MYSGVRQQFLCIITTVSPKLGQSQILPRSAEDALWLVGEGLAPDLLVTDHLMPRLSGVELARELRRRRPDLPVLVVSGYAKMDGIALDVPRLTKPFRAWELLESLASLRRPDAG